MPAQSPTLSPTLSAITAGLRGSSSGMPASILPTMSAPTSAPLVKMPPPRRAKTEISEPPKPRPIERVDGLLGVDVEDPGQDAVVAGHAEQRQADDEHAGDGAAAERDVERRADAAARRLGHAGVGAHRHVHADEAGRRRGEAADREADRDLDVLQRDQRDEQDDADDRRSSCTGAAGRPRRPPGWPRTGRAWSRCRATARAATGVVTTPYDHGEHGADERRRRPRGRSGSWTRETSLDVRSKAKGDSQTWAAAGARESTARRGGTPTAPEPRAARSSARGPCRRARAVGRRRPRAPGRRAPPERCT